MTDNLITEWAKAKADELRAQARRREIEDEIAATLAKPVDFVGSQKLPGGLTVSYSMTESIDREALLALGLDHEVLTTFVRWKPELNKAAYKEAPERVRKAIESTITRKPARPSFSMKKEEE